MATIVGLVHLVVSIPEATSLKDKRRAVKSFKDRVLARYPVAVAEVDGLEQHRRAVLALAAVGNDQRHLESMLDTIIHAAGTDRRLRLIETEIEWL
jgi:uncharacterized protein YlxP (DUF503 family)